MYFEFLLLLKAYNVAATLFIAYQNVTPFLTYLSQLALSLAPLSTPAGMLSLCCLSCLLLFVNLVGGATSRLQYAIVVALYSAVLGFASLRRSDVFLQSLFFGVSLCVPLVTSFSVVSSWLSSSLSRLPWYLIAPVWIPAFWSMYVNVEAGDTVAAYRTFALCSYVTSFPATVLWQVTMYRYVLDFAFFSVLPALGFLLTLSPLLSALLSSSPVLSELGVGSSLDFFATGLSRNYSEELASNPATLFSKWPAFLLLSCFSLRLVVGAAASLSGGSERVTTTASRKKSTTTTALRSSSSSSWSSSPPPPPPRPREEARRGAAVLEVEVEEEEVVEEEERPPPRAREVARATSAVRGRSVSVKKASGAARTVGGTPGARSPSVETSAAKDRARLWAKEEKERKAARSKSASKRR